MKYRSLFLLCLLVSLSNNILYAEEILSAPVPTLSKLSNEDVMISNTNPPVVYPESAYSITQGTKDDYNFTTQAYDSSGNLTTQYYKIDLNLNDISPEGLTWEEVSSSGVNTVDVTLPNNETRHFHYTYKTPEDYTLDTSHIGLIIKREDDIYNMNYIRNNAYFRNNLNLEHVTGNFIGNYGYGGLDNYGTIDYLISNFISNNSEEGGGIDNSGTIRQIFGDFIGNTAASSFYNSLGSNGGALYNDNGFIGKITGDFISNHSSSSGGGIYNQSGTIESIEGNFIGNYNYNLGLQGINGSAQGGAIYNGSGAIEQINAVFIGNYSESDASTNISYSRGGAISNDGQINIINSSFYNNYAKAKTDAKGGAIYTYKDMNVSADNGVSIFQGNYTDTNGVIDDNAIFVDNTKLTLEAKNNGQIYLYDNIRGTTNANITLTGDATGTINIFNDIHDANVSVDTVNVNMANDNIHNYNFNNLKSDTNANYTIDVNLAGNGSSDTITSNVTTDDNNSMSVVTLNGLNLINKTEENIKDNYIIQILNTSNNNLQLALGEKLKGDNIILANIEGKTVSDEITNAVNWNDKFETYKENISIVGDVVLATTNTLNDSIGINLTGKEITKTDRVSLGDTLALVNQLQTEDDRNFNFDTAEDKYNTTENLGQTASGTLNINGIAENGNRSEINLNGHSGFELANNSTLNLNNTKLTGNETLINVSNPDAVVNLQNSHIDGNIASSTEYKINISGNENDTTIINCNAGKANTNLNGSEFQFGSETLKEGSLNAQSGTVNLQDGKTTTYEIGTLTSDQNTNYKLDVDLSGENSSADKLSVGNSSTGTVKISSLNFVNSKTPENEFVVQLLDTDNNNIQLELDNNVSGENYALGQVSETTYDAVKSNVNWQDKFNSHTKEGTNYGNMSLATTDTTNDSIALTITDTKWQEGEKTVSMGDTLALLNQLETSEDRNFNFDTASDVYEVSSDLGSTSKGTLNINGVLAPVPEGNSGRSTINGNNHSLFKLDNETTLNVNNVKITGANNVVTGNNKDTVVNINNSEISNNAEGIKTAGSVNISGNSVIANNGNGVEVTSADSVITLTSGEITLLDKLTGVAGAKLNVNHSTVNFAKKVSALDMIAEQANINVASDNLFDGNNMTVNSASNLNMANNAVGTMHLNNLTLKDNLNMSVDVDLANKSMDRLTADSYNLGDNKVNVNQMNMLSDSKNVTTEVLFADENLRNNVTTTVTEVAYSPIYKYGVGYNPSTGNFTFSRGSSENYNNVNPSVMVGPVAAQLGGYVSMLDTYNNAFNNMDMRMLNPASVRLAQKQANRYAITEEADGVTYKVNETNSGGTWVRPFAAYDSVGLKNGPKVDSFSYGTFIGGDTGVHQFKNGGEGVLSAHVSYLGSHQSFNGNSIYQNGGNLGLTGTYYKGNFFTGLTVNAGASVADASTCYGSEDFPMFMAGVANKTGYNFEFRDGRFIIQPSLLLSYTFVNTFDYTNAAGVSINGDPLHALQISPNVRFALNTKNGWQPYLTAGMNWNIMNDSQFTANMATLPDLSMKPYVQYGLGIQKTINDNFTAYGQVLLRHGGRNGIAANAGLRYIFGHESKPQEDI